MNTGLAEQFSLKIFEPALPLASEPNASDVIVCFDNRPLHEAIAENSKNYPNGADRNVDHCKNHKQKRNQIHADSSSKENTDEMLKGITVSIDDPGKIYCGSIFTGHSFFSFLGQEGIYDSKPVEAMNIEPYTIEPFPYRFEQTKRGLLRHLHSSDRAETVSTTGGDVRFGELSLEKTWSCLAPAYRLFWREAFEMCRVGAQQLSSDPNIGNISYNILEDRIDEIIKITKHCRAK